MSDIFHEVDEEVRRERLRQMWDRYGLFAIAAAVLLIAAVGAWRGYQWWEQKKAGEAGVRFEQAVSLSEQGKHAEAAEAFAKISNDGTAGYKLLARLRAAAALSETDPQAAVKAYDEVASSSGISQTMQDLAALRAGILLVDTASFDEVRRRLEPLSQSGRPFRHTAREMLALSAWRTNDAAAARRYVDIITNDAETPQATRSRIEVLSALIVNENKG